jgi:hypothetical protein
MVAHSSRRAGGSEAGSATMRPCATMSCATASRGAPSGQGRPAVPNLCRSTQHCCPAHATGSIHQQKCSIYNAQRYTVA